MLRARLVAHGRPEEVVRLEEVDPPEPGPGQVRVRVLAAPIDPADLLVIHGSYAVVPPLPCVPGMEGMGVVDGLGAGVTGFAVGAPLLLPIRAGSWQEQVVVDTDRVERLPEGIDPLQASMLAINPPTAALLLEQAHAEPGAWILQNPGNGAVGQLVIQLAHARGLRTVNVVRSIEHAAWLRELGADAVVVGDEGLSARVAEATEGASIRTAFDGVGGGATQALASCLAPGGTVIAYGAVSRRPAELAVSETVFRGIELRGFWLLRWAERAPDGLRSALIGGLAAQVRSGSLRTRIAACHPLTELAAALAQARAPGRRGKVMVVPAASGTAPGAR